MTSGVVFVKSPRHLTLHDDDATSTTPSEEAP